MKVLSTPLACVGRTGDVFDPHAVSENGMGIQKIVDIPAVSRAEGNRLASPPFKPQLSLQVVKHL